MGTEPRRMSSVEVLLRALDALEAAAAAESKGAAVRAAQEVLAGLDATSAVRAAACLAVEASWSMRPASGVPLAVWVARVRLEASWHG